MEGALLPIQKTYIPFHTGRTKDFKGYRIPPWRDAVIWFDEKLQEYSPISKNIQG
jgi:hypothetical protein